MLDILKIEEGNLSSAHLLVSSPFQDTSHVVPDGDFWSCHILTEQLEKYLEILLLLSHQEMHPTYWLKASEASTWFLHQVHPSMRHFSTLHALLPSHPTSSFICRPLSHTCRHRTHSLPFLSPTWILPARTQMVVWVPCASSPRVLVVQLYQIQKSQSNFTVLVFPRA